MRKVSRFLDKKGLEGCGKRRTDEEREKGRETATRNSYARLSQLLSGDASIISVGRNEHTNHQQTALRRGWSTPAAEGKKASRLAGDATARRDGKREKPKRASGRSARTKGEAPGVYVRGEIHSRRVVSPRETRVRVVQGWVDCCCAKIGWLSLLSGKPTLLAISLTMSELRNRESSFYSCRNILCCFICDMFIKSVFDRISCDFSLFFIFLLFFFFFGINFRRVLI